jgi:glyoxylase-like metal-dependent hydrolase (beta-lactamase superfamily II)
VVEIAPGLHAVSLLSSRGFLVTEPELTLIDSGLPGSRWPLERYLTRIGRSMRELRRIICTHGHPDHIGGVREMTTDTDAEVLMHPADIAGLKVTLREAWSARDRGKLIAYFTRGPHAATPIQDGDVLPIMGGLRVIHTPGHTPGSVCLYAERHRIMFTGDVLQVIRGKVTFAHRYFSSDFPMACESVERLTEYDVRTIAFSHYPAWTDGANGVLARLAQRAREQPPPRKP